MNIAVKWDEQNNKNRNNFKKHGEKFMVYVTPGDELIFLLLPCDV